MVKIRAFSVSSYLRNSDKGLSRLKSLPSFFYETQQKLFFRSVSRRSQKEKKTFKEAEYIDTKAAIAQREKNLNIHIRVLTAEKRKKVFTESVDVDENFVLPVHPKTDNERTFLEESLSGNFIFDSLGDLERNGLIDAMKKTFIPLGVGIIQQGDIGDYFYVVHDGTVTFVVNHEAVGSCSKGASFGELALLYDSPRAATCLAYTDVIVWRVDQRTFRRMLVNNVSKETKGIQAVLKKVPFLKDLDEINMTKVTDALVPMSFAEGKRIVEKGEIGEVFYIVKEGTVKVHDIGFGDSQYADQMLGPGDFFGERALMTGEPRAANVTAVTECSTLCLSREAFQKTLGSLESLMKAAVRKRILMGVPVFASSELEEHELTKLNDLFEEKVFGKGEVLARVGERIHDHALYIIEEGEVRIRVRGTITSLSKGDHFGGETLKLSSDSIGELTIGFLEDTICSILTKKSIESVIGSVSRLGQSQISTKKLATITLASLTLHRIVGAGTFGKVRLVSHDATGKSYALKILSKAQILEFKQTQALVREKNIMATVQHPLIINLIATFQDQYHLYMVLDLVQGGELFSIIYHNKGSGVSLKSAKFYSACVLESLSYLHARHICYRDLKPENILVDKEGYCILIDFGFAKVVMDRTFTLCGTPEYFSPELIVSKGHNKGVDYWALGILMFELIAGYTPFCPDNADQITLFKRIIKAKLAFPSNVNFTNDGQNLIVSLLTKNQSLRYGCLARGDHDIRAHGFFRSTDFNKIYKKTIKAPWKPKIKGDNDPSNFDTYDELENEEGPDYILTAEEQKQFQGF